jgi:hypothetical protein
VVFDNIRVLSGKDTSIRIFAFNKDFTIDDVLFRNIQILGKRITSLDDIKLNKNKSIGLNIRVEAEPSLVTATYPGYLHTYKAKEAPAALETGVSVTASANGQTQSYGGANAADGDLNTYWEGAGSGQDELTLILKEPSSPASLILHLNPAAIWGKRTQTFSVSGSADGTNFTEIVPSRDYTFDPETGNSVTVTLPGESLKAVKIVFTKNTGAIGSQVAEAILK